MSARRRGLGRGLDALLADTGPTQAVAIDRLRPNRFQPRADFDRRGLDELAESIRSQGIVQPLVVTPAGDGTYTIVAGERRWRAARKAGLAEVPVHVREVADERSLLVLALVENLQRTDLNPIEEAEAYQTLKQSFGLSQEEIALTVGKGRAAVANSLRLLRLPEAVRALLREGRLTAGQARPLLALGDAEEQVRQARRAVRDGLTARDLEKLARQGDRRRRQRKRRVDGNTAEAEERLTRCLQTRVEIHRRGAGGHLRIFFHSEEELIRIYERMMQTRSRG